MIGLLQRVTHSSVTVNGDQIASIKTGLLVLIGVEQNDNELKARRLLEKIIAYRIFPDNENKMNLNLMDIKGDLLLVPQFTLPADTRKGLRPSFSNAAPPAQGKQLFEYLVNEAQAQDLCVKSGMFGADMQVSLTNDGPVTFWLQI
ncbi:MAG: D-aminoacyl-tRNA deacylase [Proteobacteria bacterium]|nr:D-aminoacyl-tRNA deacylase [Pseudomonadota bacterium]